MPCSSYRDATLSYIEVDTAQGMLFFQNVSICGLLDAVPYALQNTTVSFSINSTDQNGVLQSTTFNADLVPDPLFAVNSTISVTNVTTSGALALVTVAAGSSTPTLYQSFAGSLHLSALPANNQPQPAMQAVQGQPDTTNCPLISSSCALLSQAAAALGCAQLNVTEAPACYNVSGSLTAVSDPLKCTAALGLLSICGFNQTCTGLGSKTGCVILLVSAVGSIKCEALSAHVVMAKCMVVLCQAMSVAYTL